MQPDSQETDVPVTLTVIEGSYYAGTAGGAGWIGNNPQLDRSDYFQVSAGQKIHIVTNTTIASCGVLVVKNGNGFNVLINGKTGGVDEVYTAPADGEYAVSFGHYVGITVTLSTITPTEKSERLDTIEDDIESLESAVEDLGGDVETISSSVSGLAISNYPILAYMQKDIVLNVLTNTIAKQAEWVTCRLPLDGSISKIKISLNQHAYAGYGFTDSDGVWTGTVSASVGVYEIDVPDDAVEFRASWKYTDYPNQYPLVTANRINLTELSRDADIRRQINGSNLFNIVEANNSGRFNASTVGVYDYINAFNELSYTFPDFVKMTDIGTSQTPLSSKADQNTYPIVRFRYKKYNAAPTKILALMAAIHGDSENPGVPGWANDGGDSPQNILTVYFFLLDLLMNPEKDENYKWLTDNYIIDVVPIINPWGVQNHARRNGRDVDLNRNFDYRWAESTSTSKGSSAFSEAESQAYRDYIDGLIADNAGTLTNLIEVHSRGDILSPGDGRFWGVGPDDLTGPYYAAIAAAAKYGSSGTWTYYTSSNAEPMGWAWAKWVKNIPGCNPEMFQSLKNDISSRNSKLVNMQMTDYLTMIIFSILRG